MIVSRNMARVHGHQGDPRRIPSPVQISIGFPIRDISLGSNLVIALTDDGIVNYWGDDRYRPN